MDNKPRVYSYERFSTAEQSRGDSSRRQHKDAEEYAKKHGLILDEEQKFKDHGVSGYKGFNRIKGALNDFLKLVKNGNIPNGSVLIVEHLDRLSREKVREALTLFLNIINNGIKIVTTQDSMEYDKDSIDTSTTQLLISITLMTAAHDESKKKSTRIRKALEEKREKLRNNEIKIYSIKCPLWLKLSDDKTKFIPIPEACEAIELIFQKRLEGKGSYKIEKELNADPDVWKPPKSSRNKSGGWRDAYISKILKNRKLIGEYQPHEMKTKMIIKNGKEEEREIPVAKGDPIKDYYPKVIEENLFYRVQELIRQNSNFPGNGGGGGNKDKGNNLFSHVVKCGICGSSMQFVDKGIKYLICDSRRRKNNVPIDIKKDSETITIEKVCTSKSVRYDEFERIFLENVNELDIDSLLPDEDETTKLIKEKKRKISENNFKLNDLGAEIENFLETIGITDDEENKKIYDEKVTEKRTARDKFKIDNVKLTQEIEDLGKQRDTLKKQKGRITEVFSFLESAKDEQERVNRRFQLRQEIQNMIERVEIYTSEEGSKKHKGSPTIDLININFKATKTLIKGILVNGDSVDVISRRRTSVHK